MTAPRASPVRVFISYAHQDLRLIDELRKHLKFLEREGLIRVFLDRNLPTGAEWAQELARELESSHIVVFAVSADSLTSDGVHHAIQLALTLNKATGLRVVPLILRPCDWTRTPLGDFQALPRGGRPLVSWTNLDEALVSVVQGIRTAAELIIEREQTSDSAASGLSPLLRGEGHDGNVSSLKMAPGGIAFSNGQDGRIVAWEVSSRRSVQHAAVGAATSDLAVSPDGAQVALGVGQELITWTPPRSIETRATPIKSDLVAVAFLRASTLVVAGADGTMAEVHLESIGAAKTWSDSPGPTALAVLPDRKRLVLASGSGDLFLMTPEDGRFDRIYNGGARVGYLALTSDGTNALIIATPNRVKAIDLSSGEERIALDEDGVLAVEPLRDGRAITASSTGTLKIWDLKSGTEVRKFTVDPAPTCLAITQDGRYAVCGSQVGYVTMTDVTASAPRLQLPTGVERLELYYLAVLERPELFKALADRDEAALHAAIERFPGAQDGTTLDELRRKHPNVELPRLWASWMQTVHGAKLGAPASPG